MDCPACGYVPAFGEGDGVSCPDCKVFYHKVLAKKLRAIESGDSASRIATTGVRSTSTSSARHQRSSRWVWRLLAALVGIPIIVMLADENETEPAEARVPAKEAISAPPDQLRAHIEVPEYLFASYTQSEYPKTFALWGAEGVARIEAHERLAAQTVASSGKCDRIAMVGLSDRSSPPSDVISFIDCENGERFYIGQSELTSGAKAQSDLAMGKNEALSRCRESVRARSIFPSSVDFAAFGQSAYVAPTTGNTVAQLDFEEKNSLGNLVPQRARCYFSTSGPMSIEVSPR